VQINLTAVKTEKISEIKLRDYQEDCVNSIVNMELGSGLVVLPTGSGKTIVFGSACKYFEGKTLILAHRDELIKQAKSKLKMINPKFKIGIEKAKINSNENDNIIVGSVQTLRNEKRLEKLGKINTIIIDEAHHSTAKTYRDIVEFLNPSKLYGFTATPIRADKVGLASIYKTILFEKNIFEMIKEGYLCNINALRIEADYNLENVKKTAGDYNVQNLNTEFNTENINNLISKTINENCSERKKILIFAISIEHVENIVENIEKNTNRKVTFLHGKMSDGERSCRLWDFEDGNIDIMVNCMILTEGYDNPSIDCVLMARPTQSAGLYMQMLGRGTRIYDNKKNLLLIDITENTNSHKNELSNQITINDIFGIPPKIRLEIEDVLETKKEIDEIIEENPNANLNISSNVKDFKLKSQIIDLFVITQVPIDLKGISNLAWIKKSEYMYKLAFDDGQCVEIQGDILNKYTVLWKTKKTDMKWKKQGEFEGIEAAIAAVESYLREKRFKWLPLVNLNSKWRKKNASDKQKDLLHKLKKSNEIKLQNIDIDTITMGDASRLLNVLFK